MKRVFFTFLSAAAVCAFVCATPSLAGTGTGAGTASTGTAAAAPAPGTAATATAAPAPAPGNGNDARAQAEQAELHPMMANQYPAAGGEVHPHGRGYEYGSLDAATALVR